MKQRFTKRTRLVSALLTLAMVFTFQPFSAFAASTGIAFDSPDFVLKFKDAEFQRFLKERCDTNHNGKLDAQELSITEMTIPDDYKIKNLEGIRFFEDLETLDCHGIGLTTLNVGKNFKLRELDCSYNQLKEYYPILSSGLKILNCSHNNLTYMDLGILHGLKLEEVDCSYNKIWRIVMRSEEELVKFDCSNNELMALDVSRCYQLKQLNCSVNQLVELDVKNQTNLTLLDCHHNELTELDVSRNQNLASLTCDGNQLTTLDLRKNTSLSHLSCSENRLACVDFSNMVGSTINADGNRHPIAVLTNGTFDLNTLHGFNVGKASNWHGGSVSGTILTVDEGTNVVYYAYKCRSDIMEVSFKLNVTGTGGSTGGGSTGGGSTGGSTGGDSTIPPEAGKYQLTVTDGVATVNGSTGAVLNVKPGDTVTLTADTTKFPENEEFGWWEITPYGSVSNTLTGQYQRTATFTMPNENVSARAMSKSAGVSTGGDDGGGGGGAAILLVGGAAVAGLVGYGVYSYVSEQQLKALLPEGVAMPENRAQTALLLWNTAGRPEPAEAPAFKDVADPDTAKAAQWCVEHGLMDQKLGGRFAPDNSDPAYKTLNAYQQLVG